MTQMPQETDSANPSTMSSFKSQAQVIDGNTSAGLYEEVRVKTQLAWLVFGTLVFFFMYISYQEHKTVQQQHSTSSESLDDAAVERYVRFIFLSFCVFFQYLFACNAKTTTLQSLISQLCKP